MKYYILLLLGVAFWSGNYVLGRFISSDIEPLQLAFYRWITVCLILSPILILKYKKLYLAFKNSPKILISQSVLGITAFNTFLYYGVQTTTATNALLINSSTPMIIVLISFLILNTSISKTQLLGIILSTIGVLFLVLKGDFVNILEFKTTNGDLWIILACFVWALYTVLLKFKTDDLRPFEFFTLTTFIGTTILSIPFFIFSSDFSLSFIEKSEVLYSLLYIVIFPSILSFYFWNISTLKLTANVTGQFTHFMPIFGAIFAYFLLGERLETYHLIGFSLIILGIYISVLFKKLKS